MKIRADAPLGGDVRDECRKLILTADSPAEMRWLSMLYAAQCSYGCVDAEQKWGEVASFALARQAIAAQEAINSR